MESKLVKLTGLWLNKRKDGSSYMGGSMGSAKVVVLKNDRKAKPTDPDYVLFVAPQEPRQTAQTAGQEPKSDDIEF